jgi:hypothetical protein
VQAVTGGDIDLDAELFGKEKLDAGQIDQGKLPVRYDIDEEIKIAFRRRLVPRR